MPSSWIYIIALILLLALRVAIVDTSLFAEWIWYRGQEQAYYAVLSLKEHVQVKEFIGGWPLPVFVLTVFGYWFFDDGDQNIGGQFMLLPFLYVPFTVIGKALVDQSFEPATLITHPLIVVPVGYMYVLPWALFVWVFTRLRLVIP